MGGACASNLIPPKGGCRVRAFLTKKISNFPNIDRLMVLRLEARGLSSANADGLRARVMAPQELAVSVGSLANLGIDVVTRRRASNSHGPRITLPPAKCAESDNREVSPEGNYMTDPSSRRPQRRNPTENPIVGPGSSTPRPSTPKQEPSGGDSTAPQRFQTCSRCMGFGGMDGSCPKCGGTGYSASRHSQSDPAQRTMRITARAAPPNECAR